MSLRNDTRFLLEAFRLRAEQPRQNARQLHLLGLTKAMESAGHSRLSLQAGRLPNVS